MILLYFFITTIAYIIIKLILYFIVSKFGKFSYDGFTAAGFSYNSEKNMFYSTRDAWQKKFGYCHLYDVGAPIFRMIIDTEPIRFYYNNKSWLITFWKGQYGIVTGGEVGIYCSNVQKANKKTLYFPVNDNELLNMRIKLSKNGKEIASASAKHWWLAIFKIGMFSRPKDLNMDISITFQNKEMLNAFLNSFKKLGYTSKDFDVVHNTFLFTYKKPKTRKVWTRFWLTDLITQSLNKKNVNLYNKYLADVIDNNEIDDSKFNNKQLIMINDMIPDILKNTPNEIKKMPNENIIIVNNSDSNE